MNAQPAFPFIEDLVNALAQLMPADPETMPLLPMFTNLDHNTESPLICQTLLFSWPFTLLELLTDLPRVP